MEYKRKTVVLSCHKSLITLLNAPGGIKLYYVLSVSLFPEANISDTINGGFSIHSGEIKRDFFDVHVGFQDVPMCKIPMRPR